MRRGPRGEWRPLAGGQSGRYLSASIDSMGGTPAMGSLANDPPQATAFMSNPGAGICVGPSQKDRALSPTQWRIRFLRPGVNLCLTRARQGARIPRPW